MPGVAKKKGAMKAMKVQRMRPFATNTEKLVKMHRSFLRMKSRLCVTLCALYEMFLVTVEQICFFPVFQSPRHSSFLAHWLQHLVSAGLGFGLLVSFLLPFPLPFLPFDSLLFHSLFSSVFPQENHACHLGFTCAGTAAQVVIA